MATAATAMRGTAAANAMGAVEVVVSSPSPPSPTASQAHVE